LKTPTALDQYGAALTARLDGNWEMPTCYPTFPGLLMASLPLALRGEAQGHHRVGRPRRADGRVVRPLRQPRATRAAVFRRAERHRDGQRPSAASPRTWSEQAVASAVTVITNKAPTTSLALTTTPTTLPRQATRDKRVALSDGTFGLLIAAQNGDSDRLRNVFTQYRREATAAQTATPAAQPVSYVTAKTENQSPKPTQTGTTVDRRVYSEATRAPKKETKICQHFVTGKCFHEEKCWYLHERAEHK